MRYHEVSSVYNGEVFLTKRPFMTRRMGKLIKSPPENQVKAGGLVPEV